MTTKQLRDLCLSTGSQVSPKESTKSRKRDGCSLHEQLKYCVGLLFLCVNQYKCLRPDNVPQTEVMRNRDQRSETDNDGSCPSIIVM